jgi:hypothetical protein
MLQNKKHLFVKKMNWEDLSDKRQKEILRYEILREILDAGGSASNQFIAERLRIKYQIPKNYRPKPWKSDTWIDKISGISIKGLLHKEKIYSAGEDIETKSIIWRITDEGMAFLDLIPSSVRQVIESLSSRKIYSDSLELEEEAYSIDDKEFPFSKEEDDPVKQRRKVLRSIAIRQGQRRFRESLIDLYGCCLMSGCNVKDALEAAHIHPYAKNGASHISNGLLLRADLHTLFDLYLISIDSNLVIHLHQTLRSYSSYMELEGQHLYQIEIAKNTVDYKALAGHYFHFAERFSGLRIED